MNKKIILFLTLGFIFFGCELKKETILTPLSFSYSKDVFNNIYCEKNAKGLDRMQLMENVDYKTFKTLDSFYAKDKNNVYDGCDIVLGADVDTFKILGDCVEKDKNNIYSCGAIVKNNIIDIKTFEMLDNSNYFKDKNNVYYSSEIINGIHNYEIINRADSSTFLFIKDKYAKDKNNCYFQGKIVDISECENLTK